MSVATAEALKKIADEMKQSTHGYVKNPDGSATVSITVSADDVMQLEAWAEGAGEDFPTYLQQQVEGAIQAYCQS